MARTHPCYLVHKDRSGEWRWTFTAVNGKIIAVSSESYKRRVDCQRGVEIMKASAGVPVFTGGKVEEVDRLPLPPDPAPAMSLQSDFVGSGGGVGAAPHPLRPVADSAFGVTVEFNGGVGSPTPAAEPEGDGDFEVLVDGMPFASASGPRSRALSEAMNYASQYLDEGEDVRVVEIVTHAVFVRAAEMGQEAAPGDPDE
jgi:uncharacterized protein YegP (UPF0339 family)